MAETIVRYVLKDGIFFQETTISREIVLQQDIITRFANEAISKTQHMFHSAQVGSGLVGTVGMATKGKLAAFTLRIGELPIKTMFALEGGMMVPDFSGQTSNMQFSFKWVIPRNMSVFLMVTMQPGRLVAGDQFLVAMDTSNRMYRLPTSNVYEDCRLCSGQFDSTGTTYLDVLVKCWNQFQASGWNADLAQHGGEHTMDYARQMFRFKPMEGDAFEQQEVPSNWPTLCKKIGNDLVTQLLTP